MHCANSGRSCVQDLLPFCACTPSLRSRNSSQLGGYLGSFDLRDNGTYTLQVVLSCFFGAGPPLSSPRPILVGPHIGHWISVCNIVRALVAGAPVGVVLHERDVPATPLLPRFGGVQCATADAPGRWLDMRDVPCAPPYCTGTRVMFYDWVRCWSWFCCMTGSVVTMLVVVCGVTGYVATMHGIHFVMWENRGGTLFCEGLVIVDARWCCRCHCEYFQERR